MSGLEIFKSGTHHAVDGRELSFSAADVAATVAAYDPALFRAPLVVGHPKTDDPAYGWVDALALDGELVKAQPADVDAEFAEMVNNKRFPKISASFFHPESPSNPKPGVWYLRHVGFLGAAAPGVKGLKPASFAADDEQIVTVEFAAPGGGLGWVLTRLFRGLREHLIDSRGTEAADRVIPDYLIADLEEVHEPDSAPAFAAPAAPSAPETQEEVIPVDPNKHEHNDAAFAERESQLQAREAALAEREAKARRDEIASFAEGLVNDGKLLPRHQEGLVAFMAGLDDADTVSFAEGDGTIEKPGATWLREFLAELPQQVDFAEHSAAGDDDEAAAASFAAPAGYTVDPERLALHNAAQAYAAKHDCDYSTALAAVAK